METLALDRVVFIPTATQPLKAGRAAASAEQRLHMVQLLVNGDERFDVSAIEVDRGGLSYTVDTLASLSASWTDAALFLLLGSDAAESFPQWRQPDRIVELATVVVLTRVGDSDGSAVASRIPGARALATRRIDVSSTEIRERVREGKSIRGFVPEAVADYIKAERLYR